MNRRGLITGLAALIAAPAIVRATTLMPIAGDTYRFWQWHSPLLPPPELFDSRRHPDAAFSMAALMAPYLGPNGRCYKGTWTFFGKTGNIYTDEVVEFAKVEYPSIVIASAAT